MLNKLESADDHRDKPLPRPKWNVDTVRAGIIVHDAALLAQVYDAIAAHVGIFLRVKNAFAEGAVVNYGYRAILGNLRLESGLTVRRVFGGAHTDTWRALAEARAEREKLMVASRNAEQSHALKVQQLKNELESSSCISRPAYRGWRVRLSTMCCKTP